MLRPSHKFRSNLDSISISVLRTAFVVLHWHWHGIAFCHAFVAGPSVCVPGLQFQSKLCRRTAFFAEIKRIYDFYLRTRDTSPPHPRNQYLVEPCTTALYDCLPGTYSFVPWTSVTSRVSYEYNIYVQLNTAGRAYTHSYIILVHSARAFWISTIRSVQHELQQHERDQPDSFPCTRMHPALPCLTQHFGAVHT